MALIIRSNSIVSLIFFVFFACIIPYLHADPNVAFVTESSESRIGQLDEYTYNKAKKALESALKAYNNDPEKVTDNFNRKVGEVLKGSNASRRHLEEGDCEATNPIDKCWRCDKNWAENRKKLADCPQGFGHQTTGGKDGEIYVVTDPSDDNVEDPRPGTLRYGVIQEEPLWIIFAHSMVIRLQQELMINSHKTIDGRGVEVHIAYGAGLTIQFVENVIIHNIKIHHIFPTYGGMIRDSIIHIGIRTKSDGDGISIFNANHLWIDHVTLHRCSDGLIDAIMASTAITISNCKFNHHNDVMLLGANDAYAEDTIMQATVAFNRFGRGCIQRMPRCRFGFFHVVNNDYNRWEMYAIGGSAHPTIISQGNRFKAADNPNTKQVTKREHPELAADWQWRSEGDLFLNGAWFQESGPPLKTTPFDNGNKIKYLPGAYVGKLTRYAGVLQCKVGIPC